MDERVERARIPADSVIFGYGPMVPFALGAAGAWQGGTLGGLAVGLTIIWGTLILAFVAGVRRGFGFGNAKAVLAVELITMMIYFSISGIGLIAAYLGHPFVAVILLAVGFAMVALLDRHAALHGNAPGHFAQLRPLQMSIAVISLLAIAVRLGMQA